MALERRDETAVVAEPPRRTRAGGGRALWAVATLLAGNRVGRGATTDLPRRTQTRAQRARLLLKRGSIPVQPCAAGMRIVAVRRSDRQLEAVLAKRVDPVRQRRRKHVPELATRHPDRLARAVGRVAAHLGPVLQRDLPALHPHRTAALRHRGRAALKRADLEARRAARHVDRAATISEARHKRRRAHRQCAATQRQRATQVGAAPRKGAVLEMQLATRDDHLAAQRQARQKHARRARAHVQQRRRARRTKRGVVDADESHLARPRPRIEHEAGKRVGLQLVLTAGEVEYGGKAGRAVGAQCSECSREAAAVGHLMWRRWRRR